MDELTIAIATSGLTRDLKEGRVDTGGLRLNHVEIAPITQAMRRMVRGLEFDACEMAITTYLCARAHGKPFTAIPVFVTRNFHHGAIFRTADSDIREPKDLEGRTVGVNRGYTVTTGIWARGILGAEYGVDLGSITWAATDDEHVAEFEAPANVDYSNQGTSIVDLLAGGTVEAGVGAFPAGASGIERLFPDPLLFHRAPVSPPPARHTLRRPGSIRSTTPSSSRTPFSATDPRSRKSCFNLSKRRRTPISRGSTPTPRWNPPTRIQSRSPRSSAIRSRSASSPIGRRWTR